MSLYVFTYEFIVRALGKIFYLFKASYLKKKFKCTGGFVCHWTVEVKYPENISLEPGVVIGPQCVLGGFGGIHIGSNVVLSRGVVIETAGLIKGTSAHKGEPISIGRNVWVGTNAVILAGVSIADNAIIGAGAVVSKDVPDSAVVVSAKNRILS